MRAFLLTAPGDCEVRGLLVPIAAAGEAVVDVDRTG